MENKIKSEQLEKIIAQQKALKDIYSRIGVIEGAKQVLLNEALKLEKEVEEYKVELEEEYGAVNINLSDGSFVKIENNGTDN